MTDSPRDGQDALFLAEASAALRLLARAARALAEEGHVGVDGLLPAYRALQPSGHAGAGADVVDAAFIARCRSLGDVLLRSPTIRVRPAFPRAQPRVVVAPDDADGAVLVAAGDGAAGDALALALGLSLEAAKLAHGLPVDAAALRSVFATPADAQRALDALRTGGSSRSVVLDGDDDRVDVDKLRALAHDRPVYVVAGAGAWRVHDLLAPFARRMRGELASLGQRLGAPRDDDLYAATDALFGADDDAWRERIGAEVSDGVDVAGAGCVALRCDAMPDEADRRLRDVASQLRRGRALIICVEGRAASLAAALAAAPDARVVALFVDGSGECAPTFARDIANDHVAWLDNAVADAGGGESAVTTLPSLGLRSESVTGGGVVDSELFGLAQAWLRARAHGSGAGAKLAVKCCAAGDVTAMSRTCMELLAKLGPPTAKQRPR